jgi:hypothetical protein
MHISTWLSIFYCFPCSVHCTDNAALISTSSQLKTNNNLCDLRLLLQCKWDLCFLGVLHSIAWLFLTNILGQTIGPIFFFSDCLTLEDGTHRLTEIVSKKLPLYAT